MPKLKAFNKNENEKTKKYMIGIPAILVAIAVVIIASSYAIFQKQEDAMLANATVGEFNNSDIFIAMTLNGEPVKEIPKNDGSRYEVTVDCGDTAVAEWNSDTWLPEFKSINTIPVKCNINFEKETITLNYTIDGEASENIPEDPSKYDVTVNCGDTAEATWNTSTNQINITEKKAIHIVCEVGFIEKVLPEYSIGQEVQVSNGSTYENFYVIGESKDTLTLLSKFNINISTKVQYTASTNYSTYKTVFSTSAYWSCPNTTNSYCYESDGTTYYNLNNVTNDAATAINAAKNYGNKLGGTGRLLTREELGRLVTLPSTTGTMTGTTEMLKIINGAYANQKYIYYWLGSAYGGSAVWFVDANNSKLDYYGYTSGTYVGVRPVIEISKDKIANVVN